MTAKEVRAVAAIMMKADSGCAFCAASLLRRLADFVPGHHEAICDAWIAAGYETRDGWERL